MRWRRRDFQCVAYNRMLLHCAFSRQSALARLSHVNPLSALIKITTTYADDAWLRITPQISFRFKQHPMSSTNCKPRNANSHDSANL